MCFADNLISPCLWVGTALGNVFVVVLNLPVREQRESQPVLTITTGNPFLPSTLLFDNTNLSAVFYFLPESKKCMTGYTFDCFAGTLCQPKAGMILSMAILDGQGHLFPSPFQFWKEKDSQQNKSKCQNIAAPWILFKTNFEFGVASLIETCSFAV